MAKLISCLISLLFVTGCVKNFHTEQLFEFKSELSEGVAAQLYFQDQPIDTISSDHLQTTAHSAVYIEFRKYDQDPPYDWDAVYGTEDNYRVFHNGQLLPENRLPHLGKFSSPLLTEEETLVYWGLVNEKVFGFRTDLETLESDSILIFDQVIGTDFRYAYDFPIQKDTHVFLFPTWAGKDTVMVNFEALTMKKLN